MKTNYVLDVTNNSFWHRLFKKYSENKGRDKRKSLCLQVQFANSMWRSLSAFSHALSCNSLAKNRRNSDPTWAFTARFLLGLLSVSISGHIDHDCLKQKAMKKSTDASLTRATRYLQTHLCITSRHINYWLVRPYTKETCYSKPTISTRDCMYQRAKTTVHILVTATKEFN